MNTDKQAMENMEYVRKLLKEKQPGFAASVELALSFIHHQIELPEETMSTGIRWRRRCSGAALRDSHSASSSDIGR